MQFGLFLGPLFAVLIFNTVIFVLVIGVLVTHTRRKLKKHTTERKEVIQGTIKAGISIVSVMFMFGLSWLFGALSIDRASIVFQWLFVIFNTLQGFVLFLFFCVIGKEAREEWKNLLTCNRNAHKKVSLNIPSRTSGTNPRKTRSTFLTSRGAQSNTIRRSVGLLPKDSELDSSTYDSKVPLDSFSPNTSYADQTMMSIAEEESVLVVENGHAKTELVENGIATDNVTSKDSQLPPHVLFRLGKRPQNMRPAENGSAHRADSSSSDDFTSPDMQMDTSQLTQIEVLTDEEDNGEISHL